MNAQPVVLLAFSNKVGDYLPMIAAEQKAIKKALLDYTDRNYLQLRDVQHASTEDVFYLVNRYHNQICIFHFGGHASGRSLQLEQEIGAVQMADVKGIAGLLGAQEQLKLVFLNGCATQGQVKALLDAGVQAVIATQVSVNDSEAQKFAAQFYQALAAGSTLREAFQNAKALIETDQNAPRIEEIEKTRRVGPSEPEESMPWGLYWRAEAEAILHWKLPKVSPLNIDFGDGDAPGNQKNQAVNSLLVDSTLKAVRESVFVKELARKIRRERKAGDLNRKPSDAEKKDAVIRSYLAPVSVHLRILFSRKLSEKFDEARLRKLSVAYQKTVKFFAFCTLSDVWEATYKKRTPLNMTDEERRQIQTFFQLNALAAPAFDYFQLADVLLKVARRNDIRFYIDQLNNYPNGWIGNETLASANEHFQLMKTVLEQDVPSRLIEPYCVNSEQQLAKALCEWYFLLDYRMAVVKNIEVRQVRNMPPRTFKHAMVELDNNYNDIGRKDRWQDLEEPTDIESVLLYRDRLNDNLNLSPFILDENALIREFNSKIYFFSHTTENGLQYDWNENEKDTLIITEAKYAYVLQQFHKARQDILNERAIQAKKTDLDDDDDILSLM